jgi:hypothetical protein
VTTTIDRTAINADGHITIAALEQADIIANTSSLVTSSGGSNTAEEEDASSSKQQGVLDVSDKKMLRPKELKRWRLFNVELDGLGTPEDILKDKPFQGRTVSDIHLVQTQRQGHETP